MMDKSFINEIEAFADKGALILEEPLCNHTTFRVGGKADAFLSVRNEEQLRKAEARARFNQAMKKFEKKGGKLDEAVNV